MGAGQVLRINRLHGILPSRVQGLGRQGLGLPLATLLSPPLEAIPPLAPFAFPKPRVSVDSMGASCPLLATAERVTKLP